MAWRGGSAELLSGHRISLLHDSERCMAAMLEAIEGARREVLLEMYWFDSDATGRKFAAVLCAKAAQGLSVYVTYDAFGSWEADRSMFDDMRAAGCHVYEYNPIRWIMSFRVRNRRNHRKMLVIDGQLGLLGGTNLADAWASFAEGGQSFRDDLVRIEGPAVAQMREIFRRTFRDARPQRHSLPPTAAPAQVGDTRALVLSNDRRGHRRVIERAYIAAIERARKRVLIENSYFIPSFAVRRALARAVQRGVDVRVVLPFISDVPIASYATRKLYGHLLARGIRIYEWGQRILHSKIAVADDWCTAGTHNLDYRSFLHNLEINVVIEDAQVAGALAERILHDLSESLEIDVQTWRYRSLFQRLLENFFYRFRRWM
jgi:cardiolipin synthase A/B